LTIDEWLLLKVEVGDFEAFQQSKIVDPQSTFGSQGVRAMLLAYFVLSPVHPCNAAPSFLNG
jgi:hypothetical protein